MRVSTLLCLLILSLYASYSNAALTTTGFINFKSLGGKPYNVSYDERSFLINGERTLLLSAGMHYPRSSPSMWPQLMKMARDSGVNMAQTYVFHNYHEYNKGTWDWTTESRNLSNWLDMAAQNDLFVMVRIGPYVCAEWFYGGITLWNHDQGYAFRINSTGWENYVQEMVTAVVNYITPYLANNGGPIIALQIENEYGDSNGDAARQAYIWFNGNLTQKLAPQIPWVMCQESQAPLPIVYSCNGNDCEGYVYNQQTQRKQPAMWTENWIGWFYHWGEAVPQRSSANIAVDVLRFFAKGGVHMNYYMFHGGTNFGRTVGGPNIATSYDYDGAIDEYGIPHNPKYMHLTFMHYALSDYAKAMVSQSMASPVQLGNTTGQQEAYVYGTLPQPGSVTFLTNAGNNIVTVQWQKQSYTLNPQSVLVVDGNSNQSVYDSSILYDDESGYIRALSNSYARKGDRHSLAMPISSYKDSNNVELPKVIPNAISYYSEPMGVWGSDYVLSKKGTIEQLNITEYKSIYMWYVTTIQLNQSQVSKGTVSLTLSDAGDHELFFIGDKYLGIGHGASKAYTWTLSIDGLQPGTYNLSILSMTQGLNNGAEWNLLTGLYGEVSLDGVDLTQQPWYHQPGLYGESINIWTQQGRSQVKWTNGLSLNTPLTWYQVQIETPAIVGDPNLATWQVDMSGMTKGSIWGNNFMLGAYWNITSSGNTYTLQYYHWPRDYLAPQGKMNFLTVFEEVGGDPSSIRLIQRNSGD